MLGVGGGPLVENRLKLEFQRFRETDFFVPTLLELFEALVGSTCFIKCVGIWEFPKIWDPNIVA